MSRIFSSILMILKNIKEGTQLYALCNNCCKACVLFFMLCKLCSHFHSKNTYTHTFPKMLCAAVWKKRSWTTFYFEVCACNEIAKINVCAQQFNGYWKRTKIMWKMSNSIHKWKHTCECVCLRFFHGNWNWWQTHIHTPHTQHLMFYHFHEMKFRLYTHLYLHTFLCIFVYRAIIKKMHQPFKLLLWYVLFLLQLILHSCTKTNVHIYSFHNNMQLVQPLQHTMRWFKQQCTQREQHRAYMCKKTVFFSLNFARADTCKNR